MSTNWIKIVLGLAALQVASGCSDGGGVGQPSYGGATQVGGSAGASGSPTGGGGYGAQAAFGGNAGNSTFDPGGPGLSGSTGIGTGGTSSFGGSL